MRRRFFVPFALSLVLGWSIGVAAQDKPIQIDETQFTPPASEELGTPSRPEIVDIDGLKVEKQRLTLKKEKLIAFSSTGQMGVLRWFDRYSYNGRPFAYRVSYIHVIQVLDNGARIYAGAAYGFAYYDLDGVGVFKVEQNRNRIEKIVVPLWVQTSRP